MLLMMQGNGLGDFGDLGLCVVALVVLVGIPLLLWAWFRRG